MAICLYPSRRRTPSWFYAIPIKMGCLTNDSPLLKDLLQPSAAPRVEAAEEEVKVAVAAEAALKQVEEASEHHPLPIRTPLKCFNHLGWHFMKAISTWATPTASSATNTHLAIRRPRVQLRSCGI